ncbi:MAG TPA: hypothetical protein VEV20_05865 [Burkholderiales bacterium]|nr:hypothetical protein [Burkholderiales bacterium]
MKLQAAHNAASTSSDAAPHASDLLVQRSTCYRENPKRVYYLGDLTDYVRARGGRFLVSGP